MAADTEEIDGVGLGVGVELPLEIVTGTTLVCGVPMITVIEEPALGSALRTAPGIEAATVCESVAARTAS